MTVFHHFRIYKIRQNFSIDIKKSIYNYLFSQKNKHFAATLKENIINLKEKFVNLILIVRTVHYYRIKFVS